MKNKKNIDRLFQEKFKDFETEPNGQTWLNIQAALQEEKKERRLIPIWFKYAGVAAVFFLGLFALNTVFNTTSDPKNTTVIDRSIVARPADKKDSNATKTTQDLKNSALKNQRQITESNSNNNAESIPKKSGSFSTKTQSKSNRVKTQYQQTATVYQKNHNNPLEETKTPNGAVDSEISVDKKNNPKNPIATTSMPSLNQNEGKLVNDKTDTKTTPSHPETKETSTLLATNELEILLKEKEAKKEKIAINNSKNKWEISPNVAPIYLNTNSNGSAIDPGLSNNSKSSDTGFSYGIGVNYALSNKIAIRSGINTFSVGYNTNDVSYAAGLNTNSLANVNYTSNKGIEIQNKASYNLLSSTEKEIQKTSTGSINQKMGYYEIPLELCYTLLDKKFGINIIGGISTLFLKENEIGLVSSESNFKLGEANNLNSFHYSTNFGLGFRYKFVESFQLNFEPMLKYQVNTYSYETGNFKPVFIGLYSGISYKF